jgi:hypothetical protein
MPSKVQLEAGWLYFDDLPRAWELTQTSYRYTCRAVVIGLPMRARGPQHSLKFKDELGSSGEEISDHSKNITNDLREIWFNRTHASSWAKYFAHFGKKRSGDNNEKLTYGQVNYFFRFRWYKDDEYISNLAIASVTSRKTNLDHYGKPDIKATALKIIIPDGSSIDENILFVPLREFVSTAVATVGLDEDLKPILPSNARAAHLIPQDIQKHLSSGTEANIKELVMIDLNPCRRKVIVGTDSQICNEDDLRI